MTATQEQPTQPVRVAEGTGRFAATYAVAMRLWWHPLPLGAMLLTAINDHWLKAMFGNALTGKISDLSGMFFFPVFLTALVVLCFALFAVRPTAQRVRAVSLLIAVSSGALFGAAQLFPMFAALLGDALGQLFYGAPLQIVADPTDLVGLASVVAAHLWCVHRCRLPW